SGGKHSALLGPSRNCPRVPAPRGGTGCVGVRQPKTRGSPRPNDRCRQYHQNPCPRGPLNACALARAALRHRVDTSHSRLSPRPYSMNSAAIDPIEPPLIVRLVVSPLSNLLNPAVAKLAGRRFFAMVAAIHHVGRRSGKSYVTPVNARVN